MIDEIKKEIIKKRLKINPQKKKQRVTNRKKP